MCHIYSIYIYMWPIMYIYILYLYSMKYIYIYNYIYINSYIIEENFRQWITILKHIDYRNFRGKNTTTGTVLQKKTVLSTPGWLYMYTCRNCSNCLTCQVHLFPETIPIIPVRLRHEVVIIYIMDTVSIYTIYKII